MTIVKIFGQVNGKSIVILEGGTIAAHTNPTPELGDIHQPTDWLINEIEHPGHRGDKSIVILEGGFRALAKSNAKLGEVYDQSIDPTNPAKIREKEYIPTHWDILARFCPGPR